jgi:hypothetical protein
VRANFENQSKETVMSSRKTIETMEALGERIKTLVKKGDDMLTSAAVCAKEARERFDAGDTDSCATWAEWWRERTGLSDRRGQELLRIGRAEDPTVAAVEHKAATRERVAKHRANAAALRNAPVATPALAPAQPPGPRGDDGFVYLADAGEEIQNWLATFASWKRREKQIAYANFLLATTGTNVMRRPCTLDDLLAGSAEAQAQRAENNEQRAKWLAKMSADAERRAKTAATSKKAALADPEIKATLDAWVAVRTAILRLSRKKLNIFRDAHQPLPYLK